MRVVIDATPLAVPPTGIGMYLRETIAACGRASRGHEVVALSVGGRGETTALAAHLPALPGVSRVHRRLRGAFVLRRLANQAPVPLLEAFAGTADAFVGSEWFHPRQRRGVRAAIVYDLVPLLHPAWTTAETRRLHLRKLADVRRCDVVLCISAATGRDVVEHAGVEAGRVHVARPGVAARFRGATAAPPAALGGRPYVVSLATREPRKNLVTVVEAYALLRARRPEVALVLVGGVGWGDDDAGAAIRRLGLERDVLVTGYLPDDVVPGVLAGARAFLWPALFEGFGIPVAEAAAAGVPVACSDHPSLDEAAGPGALRVAARDPAALADAVERLLDAGPERDAAVAAGRAHADLLTWEATAAALLGALEAAAA